GPAALRNRHPRRLDAPPPGRGRANDLRLAAAAARRAPPASGLGSAEPRVRPVPRLPHRIRERPVHGPRELDTALSVRSVVASALAPVILLWSSVASAHDASAWGGLFRSSDQGATWFLASPGAYPMAAIALAVSSTDANHLLLATDAGVLRSRNGGRDWTREAPSRSEEHTSELQSR